MTNTCTWCRLTFLGADGTLRGTAVQRHADHTWTCPARPRQAWEVTG